MNQTASSSELNVNELVNCIMKQLEEKDCQGRDKNNSGKSRTNYICTA